MVLPSTFNWPDILREPAGVVLPASPAAARAWSGPGSPLALRVATYAGATSVVLSLTGFLRWVFVVPPLARSSVTGDAATRAAMDAAWTAQNQYGGTLLGEYLGQLLVIGWSVTLCVIIVRTRVLPRWLGVTILLRPAPATLKGAGA